LLELPAAQQLDTGLVVQVLQEGVARGQKLLVVKLLQLQASQQMSSSAMGELLESVQQALVRLKECHNYCVEGAAIVCIRAIKTFPAARHVPSSAVVKLLQAAVEADEFEVYYMVGQLLELPTAQQISSSALVQLLHAAIKKDSEDVIPRLRNLPAASQISSESIVALVQAAAAQEGSWCLEDLLALPAAQHLTAATLVQLLLWVVESVGCDWPEAASDLLKLPAAQQLSGDLILQLLTAASEYNQRTGGDWFIKELIGLQGTQYISSSSSVAQLLQEMTAHNMQSPFQSTLRRHSSSAGRVWRSCCRLHSSVTVNGVSVWLLRCQQHGSSSVQLYCRCCMLLSAKVVAGTCSCCLSCMQYSSSAASAQCRR
jgi:hypothetical protein